MKNQEILGVTAAELMDKLDEETDDSAVLEECLIVVRISGGESNDEGEGGWTYVQWRGSDPVWTHQLGLAQGCVDGMQAMRLRATLLADEDDGDDDD